MKKIIALVLMLSMLFSLFAVPMGTLAQENDNNFTMSQLLEASSGDETTESENSRVNFPIGEAKGANSELFVEYNSIEYQNLPSATSGWAPGLDFVSCPNRIGTSYSDYEKPTGVFADDLANIYVMSGKQQARAFVYAIDETTTSGKTANFTTKNGNTVWTINNVDYPVNPTDKAISLMNNVDASGVTDADLKARFEAMAGVTLDVPDGKYSTIGFLAGCPTNNRHFKITPIYKDDNGIANKENVQKTTTALSTTAEEGAIKVNAKLILHDWGNAPITYHPVTFTINETRELDKVLIQSDSTALPVSIISAWGERVKEPTPLEKINNAEAAMSAITVNSTFEEADEAKKLYEYALDDDNVTEESFDEGIVALFNTIYAQIVDKTKLKGTIMVKYFKGEAPTADIEIVNITKAAGKPYKVVLVYYDENDRVLGTYIEDKVSVTDEKVSFTVKADKDYENAVKVKGFIWKDFATLIPFADASEATKKDAFKVLSIGNSFSGNAHTYLAEIAQNAGFEKIVIYNLFKGGCTLNTHYDYMKNGTAGYILQRKELVNGKIEKTSKADATMLEGILAHDWDVITIQQGSTHSGKADKFTYLQEIVDYVNANKTNPDAKIVWHQTWAYKDGSPNLESSYSGMTQMEMYNAIVNAVQTKVLPVKGIDYVIPAGTAVQNARASMGDVFQPDDDYIHLNDVGCYLIGLAWLEKITGISADTITYVPEIDEIKANLATIKKAVKDAIANPDTVTK